MLCFPNAKINLGLHITEKRSDGFHNIETVFYPISWKDALEVIENKDWKSMPTGQAGGASKCQLHCSGIKIEGASDDNLINKAYNNLSAIKSLPPLNVYLHKAIPMGAGLGGGSADAAFFIQTLNTKFDLALSEEIILQEAAKLGSDCAFFIKNTPTYAFEKGDKFKEVNIDLSAYSILTIFPNIHSNTKLAYSRVTPKKASINLIDFLSDTKPENWKGVLENDFEESVFYHFPEIKKLKGQLYAEGALYASLSGSGSSVFGIFKKNELPDLSGYSSYLVNVTK